MTMVQLRKKSLRFLLLCLCVLCVSVGIFQGAPAWAGLSDDRYDGNIFVLYAGNGSLVPPRLTLKEARDRELPVMLVFYADDSQDCKKYSITVSQLQAPYGKAAAFIPVPIDTIPSGQEFTPTDPGYYYQGFIPQTVILDQQGQVVFDQTGQAKYEAIDDVFREVFDLLPREESEELILRSFNEYNAELSQ